MSDLNRYIAIMQHAWGAGETESEAMKNMKISGSGSRLPAVYFVHEFSAPCDPYVDQMGMMHWTDHNADEDNAISHKVIAFKIRGKALITGSDAQIAYADANS